MLYSNNMLRAQVLNTKPLTKVKIKIRVPAL